MSITEISVKRPTAIWMAVVLILTLGVIGYKKMGSNLLPSMNIPVISITTAYNGASAEDIKKDIIKPIEDSVSGISGIDTINSSAKEGYGTVTITFKMSADTNTAYLDVQKAVENASGKLPKDADKPILYKMSVSDQPILILSVNGAANYDELYNESDKLKDELEKVTGVGKVNIVGGQKKQLMIKLDKTAMSYYGVSVNSIAQKLQADNLNIPGGEIKQEDMDESVRVVGQFSNINDVKNLQIPTLSGGSIHLSDIAKIDLEVPEANTTIRFKNNKTIGIMVTKQSDANIVEVADNVKKQLEEIKKTIPKGMNIDVAFDNTVFITSALTEIKHNLLEGIVTTAVVLYLFFRSLRSSIVVLVAIPTSLIATFFLMYEFNFTLNLMSLLGLSLVIGTLVDDSIVVIESIQRHLDMGKNPIDASITGRREIGLAAIAISLCDIVIFVPIAFMSGMIGQIFREFGLTIAIATMFSLIVSFTLTPMLASRLLKKTDIQKKEKAEKNGLFSKVLKLYKRSLLWSLNNRWKVLIISISGIVFSIALLLTGMINTEFMAKSDQSFISIDISLSPGSTLKQTNEKVVEVENYLHKTKEIKNYFTIVGGNGQSGSDKAVARLYVNLVPKKERKKSQSEVASEVREFGKKIPGIDFQVTESDSGGGSGKPIAIKIKGKDEDTLKALSNEVEKLLKSIPGTTDIGNSTKVRNSEIRISVDRLAASKYGLNTSDIGGVIRVALSGNQVGVYRANNEENDITLKFMKGEVQSINDIKNIKVSNSQGQQILLSQVATVEKTDTPPSIEREGKQDVAVVDANVQGRVAGPVINDIKAKLKSLKVPSGYTIGFGGEDKSMNEAGRSLMLALGASIALIYMILVVLYESYLTPAIRMVALPFALMGALIALAVTGQSLNVMSGIGIIMLEGLSSKNGTLLIDYTNTLMKRGMTLRDALIESGMTRLRPIIMTSATMIVAMLPVTLALGEGSEMKRSMGVVIIGGMIVSTVVTPIVLPVVYTFIDDFKNFIFRKKRSKKVKEAGEYEL
ncbi:efflux RND transporter permease subunit [Clostridium aciditolerans]|uniref:Efflux RND transporter permease subunit n=1 Tax=Clostridium aciditolerans TaxID=339861 RepID=A0A934I1X3_9CLOT|nr:efflux RND transporter permease subunit [Clostridium aciditolerans]MBI6875332.1 efflux RND transporter permease subunit [Clostridium aciditolerans]